MRVGNLERLSVVGVEAAPLLSNLGFHISQYSFTNWWPLSSPDSQRQGQRKASCSEFELCPRASLSLLPPEDPHPANCHNNNYNENNNNNNKIKCKIKDGDLILTRKTR